MNTDLFILILAGGKGRRLWPESQVDRPKQFIDFFGSGRTQLQQTYDRFRTIVPDEQIFVVTNKLYFDLVREQVPTIPLANILAEPIWRNTGPSVAWGTQQIAQRNSDAVIAIAPSDHQILNQQHFEQDILAGADYVSQTNTILCMGVTPTRPEPGYGYIQVGATAQAKPSDSPISTVKSFVEKPERDFARMFIESGEFLWNTGLYLASAEYLQSEIARLIPTVSQFAQYPNVSFELGVIEKTQTVSVMRCSFGWADMGTWHSMYEAVDSDNVVLDSEVLLENAHSNIIKIPKGHRAVINGLSNFIVVEHDDVLLICPREDSSALIRKYSL